MKRTIVLVVLGLVSSAAAAWAQDVCAPDKVTTLSTTTYYGSVLITWTATGDDGSSGNSTSYEAYESANPITDDNTASGWQHATLIGSDASATNGNTNCATWDAACPGSHSAYFVVFQIDDAGNRSPMSACVGGSTRCSSPFQVAECP